MALLPRKTSYTTEPTPAADFPVTPGVFQPASKVLNQNTGYVSKLNAAGTALVFSTYLGGSAGARGNAIGVDVTGNVYVAGSTASTDFPTQNPYQPINNAAGTFTNCFLRELNPTGSILPYST